MTATRTAGNGTQLTTGQADKPLHMGDSALTNLTDKDRFGQLQRVATLMGQSALTPKHLRGQTPAETTANCFRVVNQAMRWGFDPFAVGDETYVVQGRLGYQGKLVAAVINARAGLVGRLKAEYTGKGDARTVVISGQFATEKEPRTVDLSLAAAKTANQMWVKDPDQKLFYSGVIKWARRHCPELILGVLTDDDLDRIASQPEQETAVSIDAEIIGEATPKTTETATESPPAQVSADSDQLDMQAQDFIDAIAECTTASGLAKIESEIDAMEATLGDQRMFLLRARLSEAKSKKGGSK